MGGNWGREINRAPIQGSGVRLPTRVGAPRLPHPGPWLLEQLSSILGKPSQVISLARLFSGKEVNESQNMGKTIKPGRQFSHSLLLNSTYMSRKSSFNIPEVFSVQFYNNGWFLIPSISLSLQLTLSWKGLQKKFSLKKKSSPWFFTLSTSDFLTL